MAQNVSQLHDAGLKHRLNNNLVLLNIRATENHFMRWNWNVTHV